MTKKIKTRNKKKFTRFFQVLALLALIISGLLYVGYFLKTKLNSSFLATEVAQLGSIENSVEKDAVIIREQEPIVLQTDGEVTFLADSGRRVAKNQVVAIVNTSSTGYDEIYSLKVIDRKLAQLESGYESGQAEYSEEYVDSRINSLLKEIQYRIKENEKELVANLKEELNDMLENGKIVRGITDISSMSIPELEQRKLSLENSIAQNNSFVKAPIAGLLSSYYDNYEDVFTVENMMNLKAKQIENCVQNIFYFEKNDFKSGEVCSYIVDNHEYFFASELNTEDTEIIKRDKKLTIGVDGVSVPAYFYDFYKDEDGRFVGLFRVESDEYNFLANRKRPIEICYEEEKGILIPNNAIVEYEGKEGVFVVDTVGRAVFKETGEIVIENEEYSLVNFDYNEMKNGNVVNLYDEIILSPKGIKESQKVR